MRGLFEMLFLAAFLMYAAVIVSHRVLARIDRWMVWLFGAGLTMDFTAAFMICVWFTGGWKWTLHSVTGLLTLAIMASHFVWCFRSRNASELSVRRFHRFSPYAGAFWVLVTVGGTSAPISWKLVIDAGIIGAV